MPVKSDVAVPLGELPGLIEALPGIVEATAPGARMFVWGHLNEGNVHVNIVGALDPAGDGNAHLAVEEAVLHAVAERGGTISSEHGIGRAKASWLELSRTPAEIAVMRSVKAAIDPAGMLSPGVLFEQAVENRCRPADGRGRHLRSSVVAQDASASTGGSCRMMMRCGR